MTVSELLHVRRELGIPDGQPDDKLDRLIRKELRENPTASLPQIVRRLQWILKMPPNWK